MKRYLTSCPRKRAERVYIAKRAGIIAHFEKFTEMYKKMLTSEKSRDIISLAL